MSHDKNEEPPLLSLEECDNLLSTCSVNAMQAHKSGNRDVYHEEINSLSRACHNLITHHLKDLHFIIAQMETAIGEARKEDMEEIDHKIKHLFSLRKQAPADTFYGEQQIINITTQITILEECKAMPIKEIIQKIIYESLERSIKVHGTEMPANFNLAQYEYHPTESDTPKPPSL